MSERDLRGITRRTALKWGALAAATPLLGRWPLDVMADNSESVVVKWNKDALQGVRESKLGPPMVARALAIVHTAMYDAWAAYDDRAVGTRLGAALRRPHREHTLENQNMAISFAAYQAALDVFPASKLTFDSRMNTLGYNPGDSTTDASTPSGVGNIAAKAVLDFRHGDGANQAGGYADTTGFTPANAPLDLKKFPTCAPDRQTRPGFDPATVPHPNWWQPLTYVDAAHPNGWTPPFVGAHWSHVAPFALTSAAQLRSSTGPAKYGTDLYISQARALLQLSAGLTDEQKVIAEYWADGPNSELPPGHWDLFAQFVAQRDHHGAQKHGVAADVKLFFALTNAIFDAGICCWDNKRFYQGVRPITAIRYLGAKDERFRFVSAWAGPCQGTKVIPGTEWLPYQRSSFPTPPFPGYSSGHSTFSAAGAEILRLFTRSDRFGDWVTFKVGSSRTEPGAVPANAVTLRWATFSEAAAQAGISRRYGGIHFEQDDLDARAAGRAVARQAWAKAQRYFDGIADNGA